MGFLKHYRRRGQCLFTVHLVLPHLLAVSAYSERKHIYAWAHHPPQQTPWKADPWLFLSKAELPYEFSNAQISLRYFYQQDITWVVILLSSLTSMIPVKASVSPFPSPLGRAGQHIQKLQHRKGKYRQAELCTHSCVGAERQHNHTPYFFRKSDQKPIDSLPAVTKSEPLAGTGSTQGRKPCLDNGRSL